MFKFTFKFTLTFMSVFLLEVMTQVPVMLGSYIWYAIHPELNLQLCARVAPRSCPGVGLGVKMYNRSGFTFKFILTFMSTFLLEVITCVPFSTSFKLIVLSRCMKSGICHTIEKNLHHDLFCYYRKRARHLSHCTLCFEKCFQDHGKTARLGQT